MGVVESVVKWLEAKAADPNCGYDQKYRWGEKGDYDCSSLVITAWQTYGVPLKTRGATYTGNLRAVALRCGFIDVTSSVNVKTGVGLQRGDILLNTAKHVATYCGNNREVEASINENGKARDGKSGDQLGNVFGKGEVLVRSYRNYPWDYVLRYAETDTTTTTQAVTNPIVLWYGKVTASALNVREYPHTSAKILSTLKRDELVAVEENSHWYQIGKNRYVCADYVAKSSGTTSTTGTKGIDVSAYQGKIDWNKVKADGVSYCILRGVEKSGNMDSTFETNYVNALTAGLEVRGVYQYLYATNETEAIAAAKNMIAKLNGKQITIWLDLEWDKLGATGRVTEIANAYIDTIKSLGYEIGVYSNTNWYKNFYRPKELHTSRFWLASYARSGEYKESLRPNVGEEMWQWGSKGKVNGINGYVDMNLLFGETSYPYVVTASQLNIRSLPSTTDPSCKIVGTLKKGDGVNVMADSLWYKIQTQTVIGWVSSAYIKKNG